MAKFTLEITLGNDAMQNIDDIAGALGDVAETLRTRHGYAGTVWDVNGNNVGRWEVTA